MFIDERKSDASKTENIFQKVILIKCFWSMNMLMGLDKFQREFFLFNFNFYSVFYNKKKLLIFYLKNVNNPSFTNMASHPQRQQRVWKGNECEREAEEFHTEN